VNLERLNIVSWEFKMIAKRAVGLILDDIIESRDFEKKALEKLENIRKFKEGNFSTTFFHFNVKENEIKKFIKRNTDKLFDINIEITKQYNKHVYFLIDSLERNQINNFRYLYNGDIVDGLNEYTTLIHYIRNKPNRRGIK